MKNQPIAPFTSKEVQEILEKAAELGVRYIRLEGFEASWDAYELPAREERAHEPEPAREEGPAAAERCDACGDELVVGKWGRPYCHACFVRRKEKQFQKSRRW